MLPIGQQLWLEHLMSYEKFPPLQAPESYNLSRHPGAGQEGQMPVERLAACDGVIDEAGAPRRAPANGIASKVIRARSGPVGTSTSHSASDA